MNATPTRAKGLRLDGHQRNLLLDAGLLLVFLVVYEQRATGAAVHEWLALLVGAALVVHLLWHWAWMIGVSKRILGRLRAIQRTYWALALLGFVTFTTAILSGLLISRSVLPTLGWQLDKDPFWAQIHHAAAEVTLWLAALHVALHRRWLADTTLRLWRQRMGSRRGRASPADAMRAEVDR